MIVSGILLRKTPGTIFNVPFVTLFGKLNNRSNLGINKDQK